MNSVRAVNKLIRNVVNRIVKRTRAQGREWKDRTLAGLLPCQRSVKSCRNRNYGCPLLLDPRNLRCGELGLIVIEISVVTIQSSILPRSVTIW